MIARYTQGSLTWLDVTNPSQDEIHEIIAECKIPLTFAHDLTSMTPRSDILVEKNALKITLDFPIVKRTDIDHPHEIKFIATKKHLITIRFEDIEAVHRFGKQFEVISLLTSHKSRALGGNIMLTLLLHLYKALDVKLDHLDSRMTAIEQGVFAEKEREMVFDISMLSKRLIDFRQTLRAHSKLLPQLSDKYKEAFDRGAIKHCQEITQEFEHVLNRAETLATTLQELRETNNSMLSTKQNEVMKTFTILAFITFPLTLFTSLFGMNTSVTPIIGNKYDFWIILGIMLFVSISFFAYFRYKKWM